MTVTAFAGERLRSARNLLGISQAELANAVGIGQSMISQIENGSRAASEDVIAAVAAATGTPRSFFDAMPLDLPTGTLRFRKLATARAGDTKRAKALFDEAYRVVADLTREAGLTPVSLPIVIKPIDAAGIEQLALDVREALGLASDVPVSHVTRLCERGHIVVAPLVLPGVTEDDDVDAVGHFGMSMWPGADEPGLIGHFPMPTGDRQRYTLAHEIGHLVLHSRRTIVADPEGEANRFAGAFLFPESRAFEALAPRLTLSQFAHLKARWGMSIQALIMRGSHLGLIDQHRKGSLFKQLSARGWRRHEPVVVHLEEPTLLWRLLTARFGKPFSYRQVAEVVGLQPIVLKGLAPEPKRRHGR
jgi:Zn-dependent peptidase ImmA (M78 family)/transcriptional regulator with XRE-family HTH domain